MDNKSEKYYLGVDGGGTKTKFLICRNNQILGEYTSGCCHYLQIGFDGLERLLRDGIRKVCQQVREDPDTNASGFYPTDIEGAFFGLAGYCDVTSDDPKIEEAVKLAVDTFASVLRPDGFPYRLGNDCENALAGALAGKPGINIIAGTGSVGCGRDQSGRYYRCGGWNYALGGDEGSGYWIAYHLLHEFQRQSDGRDERTPLYEVVVSALSLENDDELTSRVFEDWGMDRTRIAALSPIVSELAIAGDPHAKAILDGAAKELADYAIAIKNRLNFHMPAAGPNGGLIPVSGTGGIFSIGPALIEEFDRILHENGMYYVEPISTPDIGSVLLAMQVS